MPQSTPPQNYYTAGEVKKILGITDGMLYNFVDNGALTRIIPPGRKQGVYAKKQVEQLARDLQVFISTRNESKITFRKATKEDLPKCVEIGYSSHPNSVQQGLTSIETRSAWLEKNPDLYYVVEDDSEIVGYTYILPLEPERIIEIMNNSDLAVDITPEEIKHFKPGEPLHIYIATMRTKPDITKQAKRSYGVRLIGGLITIFIDMIQSGIDIKALYGKSETVDGIRALKHMGFKEISSTTNSKNYILEMNEDGKKILQKYQYSFLTRKQTNHNNKFRK